MTSIPLSDLLDHQLPSNLATTSGGLLVDPISASFVLDLPT